MKKLLVSLLLLACTVGTRAQVGSDFAINTFVSFGGGMSMYKCGESDMGTGLNGTLALGKWILSPLAARIGLDLMSVPSVQNPDYNATFASATMGFLWDPMSTFAHVYDWRVHVYPLIGLGVIYRAEIEAGDATYESDIELHASLGLNVPVRLSDNWDAFFEYKCFFLLETFDAPGQGYMHNATVGASYRFGGSPYSRRTEFESRSTAEDWFLGFGIGPNYSLYSPLSGEYLGGLSMLGVAPEIMFGRNFSNFWTIRFELTGLSAHEAYDTVNETAGDAFRFTLAHVDLMVNLTHALNFKRGVKWNFLPCLGAGAIWRYDDVRFGVATEFGLMARRYINAKGDFFVDLKYIFAPRIAGTGSTASPYDASIPSLTVGYIYNFGQSSTRYRRPVNSPLDCM